jgi:hypothetical protein
MNEQKPNEVLTLDQSMFEGLPTGFENTSTTTFKTPFLSIVQSTSAIKKSNNPAYIPEAKDGDFFNNASQTLYKELNVIVLGIDEQLVVWGPDRGPFKGAYPKRMELEIVTNQVDMKKYDIDGNVVNDTISFFCVNVDDYSDIFVFPLSVMQLKWAKKWATKIKFLSVNGERINRTYAGVWNIKTVIDSNEKGQWYTIGATPTFKRFVNANDANEFARHIKPALEMLKNAVTDYSNMEETSEKTEDDIVVTY